MNTRGQMKYRKDASQQLTRAKPARESRKHAWMQTARRCYRSPRSSQGNDGILTVVDRATKMVHLVPVKQTITASETTQIYWTNIGRLHGLPRSIVSDRDPRFVSKCWQGLWSLLGTKLRMSNAYHPQTDGQSEAMNRVVEMIF